MSESSIRRVAITGLGIRSPLGATVEATFSEMVRGKSGVTSVQWPGQKEIYTQVGAPVQSPLRPWSRKVVRSMGRVARLALDATADAVASAELEPEQISSSHTGLAYGSTHGSSSAMESFATYLNDKDCLSRMGSNGYLRFMSHTCAANLATHFRVHGPVIPTCAACVSGTYAVIDGVRRVRAGEVERMICGGAEELHWVSTGVFDVLQATSTKYNDQPAAASRPFDAERDGIAVGEGAATLVVESFESAKARGATIFAEICGVGQSCDGSHITQPDRKGMSRAMREALEDAKLDAGLIQYVNAHGTGTYLGDIEESHATATVMGTSVPVSSYKGHLGHTLGACGAIELAILVESMRRGTLLPTQNLGKPDKRCAPLGFLQKVVKRKARLVMSNNFAFGGLNASVILGRLGDEHK